MPFVLEIRAIQFARARCFCPSRAAGAVIWPRTVGTAAGALLGHGGWLPTANFTGLVLSCIEAKFCK